jgi:hypothetical protein
LPKEDIVAARRSVSDKEQVSLLSPEQERTCQELAAQQSGLASQRAAALLTMAGGATQLKACTSSGLTIGQIRYLLNVFRRKGMAIFPVDQDLTAKIKPPVDIPITEDLLVGGEKANASQQIIDKKPKSASSNDEKKHKAKKKEAKKKEAKKKEAKKKEAKKKEAKKNDKKQKKEEKAKKKMGKGKNIK